MRRIEERELAVLVLLTHDEELHATSPGCSTSLRGLDPVDRGTSCRGMKGGRLAPIVDHGALGLPWRITVPFHHITRLEVASRYA